jgi:thiol:disulfide interchange protein DsbC
MKLFWPVLFLALFFGLASNVMAFTGEGCGAGDCKDCHQLTREEAAGILKGVAGEVLDVKFSEVPGLWVVDIDQKGKRIPIYLDFSKQFLISGRVVRLATREDVTQKRFLALNKVDVAQIPLADAIVIGKSDAANRIIIFTDPECSFCLKLHGEMKKVVELRDDIAFFIKMFPLTNIHPKAYDKAKTIICEKSLKILEESLAGKEVPPPKCETDQVDKNLELGRKFFVKSTPTLVFPDGSVVPGYKSADRIIEYLNTISK